MTEAMDGNSQRFDVKSMTVSQPLVTHVQLEVKASSGRVSVLVRGLYSNDLELANVFALAGKYPAETTFAKIQTSLQSATMLLASRLTPEKDSPSVHSKSKHNDLYALAENRPEGTASVCAMPLPLKPDDTTFTEPMQKHPEKVPVRCVPLESKDDVIVIDVPPWPRFD